MNKVQTKNLTNEQLDEIMNKLSAIEFQGEILYVAYAIDSDETSDETGIIGVYREVDDGAIIEELTLDDIRKDNSKLYELKEIF